MVTPASRPAAATPAAPAAITKGEQTRAAILRAATERFGRDGFRATSVADIARDAGVGGTVPYTYFGGKEALFLAAVDDDAAAAIQEGVATLLDDPDIAEWRFTLMATLVRALDRHPLARRVLSGLEPPVTDRVIEIPAMTELRKAVAERVRRDQLDGLVRPDIDPVSIGNGSVTIILALLMSVLQFGEAGVALYGEDVLAVFEAAIDHAPPPRPRAES